MELRIGALPDDHSFPRLVRPLVDWMFKFIAWIGICAALQFAAQATGSRLLWAMTGVAYLLIFCFITALLDWLRYISPAAASAKNASPGAEARALAWFRKAPRWALVASFVLISVSVLAAIHFGVRQAIATVVDIQKKPATTPKRSKSVSRPLDRTLVTWRTQA
jgi:hypothetical protein